MNKQYEIKQLSKWVAELANKMEPVQKYDFHGSDIIQNTERVFQQKINSWNSILVPSASLAFFAVLLEIRNDGCTQEILMPINICQSMVNISIIAGFIPIFYDIECNLSSQINQIEPKLSQNTVAIVYVHAYGYPNELSSLKDLCTTRNILLIEDCAQSPTAKWKGKRVGQDGDVAIYSFGQNKPISAGGGGMLSVRDEEFAFKLRVRAREGAYHYPDFINMGFNLNVNDLHAFYIYERLDSLNQIMDERQKRIDFYKELFESNFHYIGEELENDTDTCSNFHKFILLMPSELPVSVCQYHVHLIYEKYGDAISKIVQTCIDTPPLNVGFVKQYYKKLGRTDLFLLTENDFPGWSFAKERCIFLATHHLVTSKEMELAAEILMKEMKM